MVIMFRGGYNINFTPAVQSAQDFHASPRAPSCPSNRTTSSTSPSLHQIKRKNSSDQINMIRGWYRYLSQRCASLTQSHQPKALLLNAAQASLWSQPDVYKDVVPTNTCDTSHGKLSPPTFVSQCCYWHSHSWTIFRVRPGCFSSIIVHHDP